MYGCSCTEKISLLQRLYKYVKTKTSLIGAVQKNKKENSAKFNKLKFEQDLQLIVKKHLIYHEAREYEVCLNVLILMSSTTKKS